MSEELKKFFDRIKDDEDLFLFWRLYHNPSSVLGDKQDVDEAEEEYNNLFDYCRLMMNNELTEFVRLALHDDDFSKRVDIQVWRKLNFFLYDSVDFKKNYHLLDDEDLEKLFKAEITVVEYLNRKGLPHIKGTVLELISEFNIYKKYMRLFEYRYSKEQVENYSSEESASVRDMVNLRIKVIFEKTIQKQLFKDFLLKRIEEDDYSENGNIQDMYLYWHRLKSDVIEPYSLYPGLSFEILDNLVCENRFLSIIEQKIEQGQIAMMPLDNVIEIIVMGVRIKKYQEPDIDFFRVRLGEDLIKRFDLKRAESLISKLTLYRIASQKQTSKIIQFGKRLGYLK